MARRSSNSLQYLGAVLPILAIAACGPQQPVPAVPGSAAQPGALPGAQVQVAGQQQVLRGRLLTIHHGCGDCHGGMDNPAAPVWLSGWRPEFPPGVGQFQVGPFTTYARNITPDNATGIGRFSERQIFNALRYGLRPGETPDVEITGTTPGQGNYPARPAYLAPPMPWIAFRHMSDEELRAIAAYLKRGVRPMTNRVPDSEGPPDFWASTWADMAGPYPAPAFPAAQERQPQ
jgi:mono/diheme cytochrome c family protein